MYSAVRQIAMGWGDPGRLGMLLKVPGRTN